MNHDIIIYPQGALGNKLIGLMASIDLQIRSKKKIKIIFSPSYNDLLYNNHDFEIFNDFPELNIENITIEYRTKKIDYESYLLESYEQSSYISNYLNNISKNKKINIHKSGILYNEYPLIKKGIIKNTWIQGFKNKGAPIIKNWLSDVTKFKYYKKFEKKIGFDWYDDTFEYVAIYLEIGGLVLHIKNNTMINKFILNPDWYDKALKILKNKSKKPLKILFINNLRVNSKILFEYIKVFNKYGDIINNLENIYELKQVDILLLMSKVDHYIGPRNYIQISSYLYAKNHSITIINSNNTTNIPYRKQDYPSNWVILDDKYYRIQTTRDLERYNLDFLDGISIINKHEKYIFNKKTFNMTKNKISSMYQNFYDNFDKFINSKVLKDLLLYRIFEYNDKIYHLNSNISIKEGLFLFLLIQKYKPKKILEIGFACGTSAAFMLLGMDKKSKLTSVDPFQKLQWDSFGLKVVEKILEENNLSKTMHQWKPNYSHTFFNMKNNKYDLCFIDGDHSYEGTMIDLEGCHKLLNKNGLLVIDDVLHKPVKKAIYDFINNNSKMYKKIENNLQTMSGYIKLK